MTSTRARRVAIGVLATIAGGLLLVWQVRQAGTDLVLANLAAAGPWFALVLVLSVVRFLMRTLAWRSLIGMPVPTASALAAMIAGDALGNITPLGLFVSEPTKALFVKGHIPTSRALAALAAENFFYSVSVAVYIVLGTIAMLLVFGVPDSLRWVAVTFLVSMAGVLALTAWLAWRRPSFASATLSRIPIARVRAFVERARAFERDAYASIGPARGRLSLITACQALFHVLSFAETWLLLWILTATSAPILAFVLDTFNRVVNIVFRNVPLKLGVDEWTSESVSVALGVATGIGTSMALIRKGRILTWAIVGVALLVRRVHSQPTGS